MANFIRAWGAVFASTLTGLFAGVFFHPSNLWRDVMAFIAATAFLALFVGAGLVAFRLAKANKNATAGFAAGALALVAIMLGSAFGLGWLRLPGYEGFVLVALLGVSAFATWWVGAFLAASRSVAEQEAAEQRPTRR